MQIISEKPTIFISHCWDDNDMKSEKYKEYIVDILGRYSYVIFDKKSFKFGNDLEKEEEKIKHSDCVVIFLSNNYITAANDENRGSFRENKLIQKIREDNQDKNDYLQLPIFFITLNKIKNVEAFTKTRTIYFDISILGTEPSSHSKIIENKCLEIIRRANLFFKQRDTMFKSQFETEVRLWYTNKAVLREALPRECIVKTKAYDKIFNQYSSIIIGRKGSGKSTFFESLKTNPDFHFYHTYKTCIPISAETLFLDLIYSKYKDNRSDIAFLNETIFLDHFWKFYFCVHSFLTICQEYCSNNIEDELQRDHAKQMLFYFCEILNIKTLENLEYSVVSNFIIEKFFDFIKSEIIDYAAEGKSYEVSIKANFNYLNVLKYALGEETYVLFKETLQACRKKIYIYFDAFDTYSEDFRRDTLYIRNLDPDEAAQRFDFESKFYRQLILTVESIKENCLSILEHLDFCIILPKDRVDQIRVIDRDFSKRKVVDFQWTAKELLELLIRRFYLSFKSANADNSEKIKELESIYNNTSYNKLEKCEKLLTLHCPNIAPFISVQNKKGVTQMSILKYILSMSFWRPRDIISYAAQIVTSSKSSTTVTVNPDIIKELFEERATNIIENEFINEYKNTFRNIADIIKSLRNLNAVYNLKRFLEIINEIEFRNPKDEIIKDVHRKFSIMYELGMVGIIKSHKNKLRFNFVFTEGNRPLDDLLNSDINERSISVVINPLFYTYCNIKYNVDYLICDFDENYLELNDMRI